MPLFNSCQSENLILFHKIKKMKKYIPFVIAVVLFASCSSSKQSQLSASELNSVPVKAENTPPPPAEKAITEIEEKLVEIDAVPVQDYSYFVIIGSFRDKQNAMNYQAELGEKGFSSLLLKNQEGLYRVSVKSTDDISEARKEIQRIRNNYPDHNDTWLLIRKK